MDVLRSSIRSTAFNKKQGKVEVLISQPFFANEKCLRISCLPISSQMEEELFMAKKKKCAQYSGIGGQAVLEGVMMKNKEKYAVAVRKPDGEISVEVEHYAGLLPGNKIKEFPLIRGVFNFVESLILGMRCVNYSAIMSDDVDAKTTGTVADGGGNKFISAMITCLSIVLAIGIFIVLPYYLAALLGKTIMNDSLLAILEGVIRIVIL